MKKLTDARIEEIFQSAANDDPDMHIRFARYIEAELAEHVPKSPAPLPPPKTMVDPEPIYALLLSCKLALLAVNSGAAIKAISDIDQALHVAPDPISEPENAPLLRLSLEALESECDPMWNEPDYPGKTLAAIKALRSALSLPSPV